MINVITLNCCGLKKPEKLFEAIESAQVALKSKPEFWTLLLQETKIEKLSKEQKQILDFFDLSFVISPAVNCSGGLLTIFPKNLKMRNFVNNNTCHGLFFENYNTAIFNVYINPKNYHMGEFFSSVDTFMIANTNINLVIAGDFNAINSDDEYAKHYRKNDPRCIRFQKLQKFMETFALADVSAGEKTHFNRTTKTSSRIDYIYSNFESSTVDQKTFSFPKSDHDMLIFQKTPEFECYQRGQSFWKMNDIILFEKNYSSEVTKAVKLVLNEYNQNSLTANEYDILKAKIRDILRGFCIKYHRDKMLEESSLRYEISNIEKNLTKNDKKTFQELDQLKQKLSQIYDKRIKQKLKLVKNFYVDCNSGDSKSVKRLLEQMQTKNTISKLQNSNGIETENIDEILQEFYEFYQTLYKKPDLPLIDNKNSSNFLENFCLKNRKGINSLKNLNLHENFSQEEIENAIRKLNSNSSPGCDGITSNFFKRYSTLFSPLLVHVFNNIATEQSLPSSFGKAILKLLPKKENSIFVGDFRPISLINTDQKILSHVISDRLLSAFNRIIRSHQHAYLPNRQIQSAHIKIQHAILKMNNEDSLLALDFQKAFDSVNREYLSMLMKVVGIPDKLISIIELIYSNNKSFVEINGFISKPIEIQNGVRQGCPLSALLFIFALEPLLQQIQEDSKIKSKIRQKCIAYADDVTLCITTKSFARLQNILEAFTEISGLKINKQKSEVLCKSNAHSVFVQKPSVKILGIRYSFEKNFITLKETLKQIASNSSKFCLKSMTLRARALNINTFIYSKIIFQLQNHEFSKNFLKSLEKTVLDNFWLGKKHNLSKNILHSDPIDKGVGLKNLSLSVIAAKIFNFKSFIFNSRQRKYISDLKNSLWYKKLAKYLKKFKVILKECHYKKLVVRVGFIDYVLTETMRTKDIYQILISAENSHIAITEKIKTISEKIKCEPEVISRFLEKIWKDKKLLPFHKNNLYLFFLNCFLDKIQKWNKKLVSTPLCFDCKLCGESFSHLLVECSNIKIVWTKLGLKKIEEIFQEKSKIGLKLITARLLSSWLEKQSRYYDMILSMI